MARHIVCLSYPVNRKRLPEDKEEEKSRSRTSNMGCVPDSAPEAFTCPSPSSPSVMTKMQNDTKMQNRHEQLAFGIKICLLFFSAITRNLQTSSTSTWTLDDLSLKRIHYGKLFLLRCSDDIAWAENGNQGDGLSQMGLFVHRNRP